MTVIDWADATDPYEAAAPLLGPDGTYGISDSAWALHLLGLQGRLPGTAYRSLTDGLPMMRAVKGPDELARLSAAGAAADAAYGEILKVRFAGRRETEVAADLAEPAAPLRARAGRLHGRRFGAERGQPAPRGRATA